MALSVPTIPLGGLPIAVIDRPQSARLMVDLALERRGTGAPPIYMTSANGQVLSLCANDPEVRAQFAEADLIHADGQPLVTISRFTSPTPLPERVATTDLFHDVSKEAVARNATCFMLGGTQAAIIKAERNVRKLYPGLRLIGTRNGYFNTEAEEIAAVEAIAKAKPDILWLALGAPREQAFVLRHRDRLKGVGLIKTSGGLFDFLSGERSRAPQWMQDAGLEWLYRMALEPRRLFVRYALTNPHALFLLLTRSN